MGHVTQSPCPCTPAAQVREAACLSLARLVPRLPFSRSYYSPVEALLLALATDGSETVHAAALSHLVPALLTWQPPDSDLVVTSGMARVVSEMGQLARQLGPVSGQEGGSGLARRSSDGAGVGAGGAAAGGLRHTASMNARDGLAAAQEASGFGGGGGGAAGNQQVLFPPASRAGRGYSMSGSTLLPGGLSPYAGSGLGLVGGGQGAAAAAAQGPVHLGRRRFASQVHLVLYQLLQVRAWVTGCGCGCQLGFHMWARHPDVDKHECMCAHASLSWDVEGTAWKLVVLHACGRLMLAAINA